MDMLAQIKAEIEKFKQSDRALGDAVNIVMALVMIIVVGAIGIFIADRTITATGTPSNPQLYNFSNHTLSAGSTGAQFLVILVIAFIGGVAVTYLFGMLGKRRS